MGTSTSITMSSSYSETSESFVDVDGTPSIDPGYEADVQINEGTVSSQPRLAAPNDGVVINQRQTETSLASSSSVAGVAPYKTALHQPNTAQNFEEGEGM